MIYSPDSLFAVLMVLGISLSSGILIGCIGIGGVIILPGLVFLTGVPIQQAIAAAMMGFIFSGVISLINLIKNSNVPWTVLKNLCIGALPSALAGAWVANRLNPFILEGIIGILVLFTGLNSLSKKSSSDIKKNMIAGPTAFTSGLATGFLSALSGTGGPLILVPLLMWLKYSTTLAIHCGQAIQLPIATIATIGNFVYGSPDLNLSLNVGLGLIIGTYLGSILAKQIPKILLTLFVSVSLIVTGTGMLIKIMADFVFNIYGG